jgi:hypothetical protein
MSIFHYTEDVNSTRKYYGDGEVEQFEVKKLDSSDIPLKEQTAWANGIA